MLLGVKQQVDALRAKRKPVTMVQGMVAKVSHIYSSKIPNYLRSAREAVPAPSGTGFSAYHTDSTMLCATCFNQFLDANALDDSRTYFSLATPMRATISLDRLTTSFSSRGSGRRTMSSSAGMMKLVGTACFSARETRTTGGIIRPPVLSNTSRRARASASVNLNRWVMASRATQFTMGIEKLSRQLKDIGA